MNNINDLQEQFENLIKQGQELLEKMKENQNADVSKKVKRWKPKEGDGYWLIRGGGKVEWELWAGSKWDIDCYNFHNCFQTKKEAQKELDRRLAEQELLEMCDWSETEKHVYVIEYDVKTNSFDWDFFYEITSPYRFASEESVKKALDTLGTDKLKLIFRID